MSIRAHSNVLLKRLWSREFSQAADDSRTLAWVFLGPPVRTTITFHYIVIILAYHYSANYPGCW
jgi:hypothetical protein